MKCKCTQHDVGLKWTHTRHILNELCCVLKRQLLITEPEIKLPPAPGWSWKIFFKANSRKDLLILCMRLLLLHFLSLSQKHNTPSRVASQSLRVVKEGERRFYISIVPDLRRPLSLWAILHLWVISVCVTSQWSRSLSVWKEVTVQNK